MTAPAGAFGPVAAKEGTPAGETSKVFVPTSSDEVMPPVVIPGSLEVKLELMHGDISARMAVAQTSEEASRAAARKARVHAAKAKAAEALAKAESQQLAAEALAKAESQQLAAAAAVAAAESTARQLELDDAAAYESNKSTEAISEEAQTALDASHITAQEEKAEKSGPTAGKSARLDEAGDCLGRCWWT